jgi:hypothetical protein
MPDSDGMPGFPHLFAGAFACFFGSVSQYAFALFIQETLIMMVNFV